MLAEIGAKKEEWAGIPMPLGGDTQLVVEKSHPLAAVFNEEPKPSDIKIRNQWYSARKRCTVVVAEKDGKIRAGLLPAFHHIGYDFETMGCSDAWGIEQEQKALQLLGTMIRHFHFKRYLLTGMFIERSERSGLTYIFRKLKPTVVVKERADGQMYILAALCMHPIAYYQGSWAGAMCPTDDVIAHLSLMRADEHMYWKRCNQHQAYRPEAGL